MKHADAETTSFWRITEPLAQLEPLKTDAQADVCVIGAGISGLSCAYHLVREGKSVVVLEDGAIGSGQTQRTTAHLSNAIDDRYVEIERVHGEQGARLAAQSHSAAIDRIEQVIREEKIDCDFGRLDGYLFTPPGDATGILEHERDAARRAGLSDVDLVPRAPLGAFETGPALRFPRQGHFHPIRYLRGLAEAVLQKGGRIHTGTHVDSVEGGDRAQVVTQNGPTVHADAVVVATNTPINDLFAIHTKQAPYLSYVIAASLPASAIENALYWDTLDPYHYIRLQPITSTEVMVIIGGEDHKAAQVQDQRERFDRLESWSRERLPRMGPVLHRWSGMVMETIDGLAFIGRNPMDKENVFVATGDSGMGMTHGTIAGMLLTDLILGRDNPWSQIYDPSRKPVWGMAWKEYLVENLNVAKQYFKDWLGAGDARSREDIVPGTGSVVSQGLSKIAVYRDEAGVTHEHSAVCAHLGCVVHWNDVEKTWDCPCHGSRFDPLGQVINGPANRSLAALEKPREAELTARSRTR